MTDMIRREINRALAGARQAFRATLSALTLDTRLQRVEAQGLAGEQLDGMELLQQFGFTSAPPAGSQVVVVPLGGRTTHAVVIATEHGAYRFQLDNDGEAAMYNQWGDSIHLRKDRSIRVTAALKLEVVSPLATFSGDMQVDGTITAAVDVIGAGVHLKTHRHSGVAAGGANTGAPI